MLGHGQNRIHLKPVFLFLLLVLAGCATPPPGAIVQTNVTPTLTDRVTDVLFVAAINETATEATATGWLWKFGDGAAATTKETTHRYPTLGVFQPSLEVTLSDGETLTVLLPSVTVQNRPPVASGSSNAKVAHRNAPIHFTDASSDADGSVASRRWDFGIGDSSNGVASIPNPSFTYRQLGTFTPRLTVTDNDGGSNSTALPSIVVENIRPLASFDFSPSSPGAGQSVSFNDKSSDADGTLAAWAWDFGDGGQSSAQAPTHGYAQAGTYTVRLTVRDSDGGTATAQQSVVVAGAVVSLSNFQYTDNACNDVVPFTFTLANTGGVEAKNVAVRVSGGYQDYTNTVPSIAPGQSGTVSGTIKASDACGSSDHYAITVTATPSNGLSVSRSWAVDI